MDPQEANKKKAKNWLHRFLKLKNRLHDHPTSPQPDECIRREMYEVPDSKRNSLKRSLRKMQTRVKSCMFPQEMTLKRPLTDIPCSSRIPDTPPPPVPERPRLSQQRAPTPPPRESSPPPHRIPTDEIVSLANCYWYWGPMPTAEAEEKLQFKPDGTFLVRDSSSTSYLFSISFRSVGKTMHARIEYSRGRYNLCGTYAQGFETVTELIQDAMKTSERGIYCYSRRGEHACEFPVRLTKPISRYTDVRDLKHLCKFVIRQCTNINDIPNLPLPTSLHEYLLEKPYF